MEYALHRVEPNQDTSVIALHANAIADSSCQNAILTYLQSITDFRAGTSSFGSIPRLQKWYNESGEYFSKEWADQCNPRWVACPYEPELTAIQRRMQAYVDGASIPGIAPVRFNSCLMNMYRTGMDSIKPHRDSEVIFGDNPTVAILSVGSPRDIVFRRIVYDKNRLQSIKPDKAAPETITLRLTSGSVLLMGGAVQKYYSHEIAKQASIDSPRYSLTFRQYQPK
jgi:hypothetical protein